MVEVVESVDDELLQWVTFCVADELYGVNVLRVQEVLRVTEITPVPGVAGYVLGIINLRGNIVTVLDTRKRLGLPAKEITDDTRIVIVEVADQAIGILVDSVAEVIYVQESDIDSAPNVSNETKSKYIQGVYSRDDDLYILIDLDKLIPHSGPETLAG